MQKDANSNRFGIIIWLEKSFAVIKADLEVDKSFSFR
jgi:hypothetical protein